MSNVFKISAMRQSIIRHCGIPTTVVEAYPQDHWACLGDNKNKSTDVPAVNFATAASTVGSPAHRLRFDGVPSELLLQLMTSGLGDAGR